MFWAEKGQHVKRKEKGGTKEEEKGGVEPGEKRKRKRKERLN